MGEILETDIGENIAHRDYVVLNNCALQDRTSIMNLTLMRC